MLPIIAFASVAAGGTTGFVIRRRRQLLLRNKPQKQFKVRLSDNSDTAFRHLQRPIDTEGSSTAPAANSSSSSRRRVSTGCPRAQHNQQFSEDDHAAIAAGNTVADLSLEQQQQQHPYAAEIQQLLQYPTTPILWPASCTTVGSSSSSNSGNSSTAAVRPAAAAMLLQEPPPLSDTPLLWIDTVAGLKSMLDDLRGLPAVALDTEHNSMRSYLGITCLLQISTGFKDYLIDCLRLHDHLHLLRPLLSDPSVTKVLHGGVNDVIWLQRDAHLYLINIFDTEKAAQVLGLGERSLAHLLRRYCGVHQDKTYQTADWRIRPLPAALQQYARIDVHWLLLLAGKLIQQMQCKSPSTREDPNAPGPLLISALQKSNSLCLKLYQKPTAAVVVRNALAAAMRRYTHQLQQQQQQQQQAAEGPSRPNRAPVVAAAAAVSQCTAASSSSSNALDQLHLLQVRHRLNALLFWRDAVARSEDEGPQYILPDAAALSLACQPPKTASLLLAAVHSHVAALNGAVAHLPNAPRWEVPTAVKKAARHLVKLLQNADVSDCYDNATAGVAGVPDSPPSLAVPDTPAQTAAAAANDALHPALAADGVSLPSAHAAAAAAANGGRQQQRRHRETETEFREKMIKKFSAKTKVYDNCRMLSTTGELLCFCDLRKLQWYIDRGLAELIEEDPPTIRLLFAHKNADQQVGLDGFYSTSRANRCVVCGEDKHYLRYRVVPSCYRRCFPVPLKSHRSHDIVLLCIDCHQVAHKAAEILKREIAQQYGIPLNPFLSWQQQQQQSSPPAAAAAMDSTAALDHALQTATPNAQHMEVEDDDTAAAASNAQQQQQLLSSYKTGTPTPVSSALLAHQARAAAIALVKFGDSIPQQRRMQLQEVIARFLGKAPAAVGSSSSGDLVGQEDIETALLFGLNARKRKKTLQKLKKHMSDPQSAAAASDDTAAAAATGSSNNSDDETNSNSSAAAAAAAADSSKPVSSDHDDDHARIQNDRNNKDIRNNQNNVITVSSDSGHTWHGRQVVSAALSSGGEEALHLLVKRFRRAFVVTCRPKYLPESWDVDAHDVREFGEYSVYAKEREQAAAAAASAAAATAADHAADCSSRRELPAADSNHADIVATAAPPPAAEAVAAATNAAVTDGHLPLEFPAEDEYQLSIFAGHASLATA